MVIHCLDDLNLQTMTYLADSKRSLIRAFIGPAKHIDYATADYVAWVSV